MEEINAAFNTKEDTSLIPELSKNDSPLLDMEGFDTLDTSPIASSGFGRDQTPDKDSFNILGDISQSGLISTTRPLVTEEMSESADSDFEPVPTSNLLDYGGKDEKNSALADFISGADTRVEDSFRDPVSEPPQQRSDDSLLIGQQEASLLSLESERTASPAESDDFAPVSFTKAYESEVVETLPKIKDPKIVPKAKVEPDNYESGLCAYETAAQPVKTEVAMEAEKVGNAAENNIECDCPFSPGAWFDPEKLHPVVANYVYWKDPKQSGIALGASLVLLLSFKYFSVISVAAYLTVALLSVTVSFRIYKNIVQAVQKSSDGHPFKEYLEMDITLSQDKVSQTVETLIHHLNCVSEKLRSLILVEDLVDTIKLLILAWCMTYVGAWFNGLTLIILGVVSAFTLPKVYETNKAQIDVYAELVRTKGKEVIDMVNAKMPLGKKKKDQ